MESGKLHVVNAVRAAEQALERGDPIGLAAAYAELAKWDDLSRAHQARRVITELVLAHGAAEATTWVPIFMCALRMVLDALEREPCEPTTLNFAMSLESVSIHVCCAYIPDAAEYNPFNKFRPFSRFRRPAR
jgi:hypothetical protein